MAYLKNLLNRYPVQAFFIVWLLVNLIQAGGTELLDDEAYYWVYSHYLDWGYFDHPPMIAILIKVGYSIFHNELGVRLFLALMNTATLFLVYRLLPEKDNKLFYAIAGSMAVLQIGGILAVPDIPLTFFTALFFWQYKKFLDNSNLANSLLLGWVMALMLYSKYHGVLIILLTLASNPKLFRQWQAYLAALFGAALFLPHLIWQYNNGFPSVQYHLMERNAPAYRFSFTSEYLLGQVLLAGPLIGWLLLWAAAKYKSKDPLTKALKYSMVGFYLFFLISTLKGRVEANWTVPALVPLIILAHSYLASHGQAARWVYRLFAPTLILIVLARVYLLTDIKPLTARFKDEMHNNKTWAASIKSTSGGLPVIFLNSYQRPSKYWFYTGDTSYSLNTTMYRRNNYNFWPVEASLQGRTLYAVDFIFGREDNHTRIPTDKGETFGKKIDGFQANSSIRLLPSNRKFLVTDGTIEPFDLDIKQNGPQPLTGAPAQNMVFDIYMGDSLMSRSALLLKAKGDQWQATPEGRITLAPGKYKAKLGLATWHPNLYSQNSPAMELVVE